MTLTSASTQTILTRERRKGGGGGGGGRKSYLPSTEPIKFSNPRHARLLQVARPLLCMECNFEYCILIRFSKRL